MTKRIVKRPMTVSDLLTRHDILGVIDDVSKVASTLTGIIVLTKTADGNIEVFDSGMNKLEALGLLTLGKHILLTDADDED